MLKPVITTLTNTGGKVRTAYLVPKAVSILRAWLRDEHPSSPDNAFVFESPVTGRALTEPAIDKRISCTRGWPTRIAQTFRPRHMPTS